MSPLPDRLRRHADGDQHPPAPWYVVPADHMWFTRLASAAIVMQILRTINREYPAVAGRMARARAGLVAELASSRVA
jgi:hypothetical protein